MAMLTEMKELKWLNDINTDLSKDITETEIQVTAIQTLIWGWQGNINVAAQWTVQIHTRFGQKGLLNIFYSCIYKYVLYKVCGYK